MTRRTYLCGAVALLAMFSTFPQGKSEPETAVAAARLNNLGAAYMGQQLFEKALKTFQQAASLDPKLRLTRVNEGIAELNLGHVDGARTILERASKTDPNDLHVWYNLGLLYRNTDDAKAAVDAFHRVTDFDPNDADTWYFLGASYAQIKQFPQALEAFHHALKVNPLHASAQFGLARAYQQSGNSAEAREHLARFQYITQNKLGAAISLAYGEQGKYSLAEESPEAPIKPPNAIPVRFADVTEDSGITTKPGSTSGFDVTYLGPGACFLDYDDDGRIDLFLPGNGSHGGESLYHNLGGGKFADVTQQAGFDSNAQSLSCTAGDYDNDGFPDLVVVEKTHVLLFHNEKNGTFKDVTGLAGLNAESLETPANPISATFIDYDHDGDLDLYIAKSAPVRSEPASGKNADADSASNVLWRNNGNGTFTDVSSEVGLKGERSSVASIGTDYNNDRAVDLILAGSSQSLAFFQNPREGQFEERKLVRDVSSANGMAILDIDHDGWMDLAVTGEGNQALSLWRNNQGKSFEPVRLQGPNWFRAFGVAAIDYDNDGWVDLVAVGETPGDGKGEVHLFRNLGPEGFKDVTTDVGLDKIHLQDPRAVVTGDFDNDGATDLFITQSRGPAVLLKNEGGNKNHWLRLALKGLNDNRSAIGTKVEVFSDGIRQKFEIYGSSGYLGQNSPYFTVGLGQATQADVVRMLWPTGVLQDETGIAADRVREFTEIDRRGSSCPTLFVWDGKKYAFVDDMLGAGVVGHWIGPAQRDIPRPVEYIKIDRNIIREKNGKLSFRFMEPLEEAVYLDQARLMAVDHPADFEVYPNEYFASNPPYPPFKVIAARDARPPVAARDEHGRDALPDLLAHRYFGDFEVTQFLGFAKLHRLELDLGEPYRRGPLYLLMNGEVEYFSANSMYAANQAGLEAIPPYVEALGADGKWTRVVEDMGFPAGGERTISVDLTGKLPAGTQGIRISTNLQIYWDTILIDRTDQKQDFHIAAVPLLRADLRFHGFPLKIEGDPPGNVMYVYEKASPTGPYARPAGNYTRYGDVLPLLKQLDDKLVVFGSGDEVGLDFDPSKLPAVPQGWVRDYFFAANGYEKDMDFYAFDFDEVAPLPFRTMETYPYPGKKFPLDDVHLDYLVNYNTRYMSGNEQRGYAFQYEQRK